jgi:hypothetical protein
MQPSRTLQGFTDVPMYYQRSGNTAQNVTTLVTLPVFTQTVTPTAQSHTPPPSGTRSKAYTEHTAFKKQPHYDEIPSRRKEPGMPTTETSGLLCETGAGHRA